MNIHPISNSAFTSLNEQVGNAYEKASCEIMLKGAADVRWIHPVTDPSIKPSSDMSSINGWIMAKTRPCISAWGGNYDQ